MPPRTPELTAGPDRFHEPRREDCPWCGSRRLRTRLRTPDLLHHRPGVFTVDVCRDCAHTFQNPRLSPAGLALYHRDFYDGRLEDYTDRLHTTRAGRRRHRAAARAMLALPEPESWLDVGTGHAHFPRTAQEFFAYTSFDGLDPTLRVGRAQVEGHIEEAHCGYLAMPEVLARLRGRYDVVSMLHHLQHTPDPRAELRAALTALRPGGHVLIDVPNPRSAFGRLLGRWWIPYGQPRHLHLMPPANLRAELESQGCEVLRTDRKSPHLPYDISAAFGLVLGRLLPRRWLRAAAPLVALAGLADHALAPLLRRTPFSNAYLIVARKGR
ncbi:class I SAM-dependent methyltransferase [Streptomyces sp. NPDC086777]|uniref:class I SAM-dependent methyltransferase n=1 Tax=Streptomyces sp. NPDC086777 TaxID=3154866 RepID=UPI00344BDCBE